MGSRIYTRVLVPEAANSWSGTHDLGWNQSGAAKGALSSVNIGLISCWLVHPNKNVERKCQNCSIFRITFERFELAYVYKALRNSLAETVRMPLYTGVYLQRQNNYYIYGYKSAYSRVSFLDLKFPKIQT